MRPLRARIYGRIGDVVAVWRAHPGLRRRAEGLGEANRHLARHPRDAVVCCHIDGLNDTTRLKLGRLLAGEAFAGAL